MQFLTIQDGDYTINLNQIVSIDWTEGDNEATVHMANEQEFTCSEGDYDELRRIMIANHVR